MSIHDGIEEALPDGASTAARWRKLGALSLASLGVVFGDIGTSPLYALRECFYGDYAVAPSAANVLGVLSLIAWSLILVISVKYLVFVLRADNDGEGGILALMELAVDGIFTLAGLVPASGGAASMHREYFVWDYSMFLNLVFLPFGAALAWVGMRTRSHGAS